MAATHLPEAGRALVGAAMEGRSDAGNAVALRAAGATPTFDTPVLRRSAPGNCPAGYAPVLNSPGVRRGFAAKRRSLWPMEVSSPR